MLHTTLPIAPSPLSFQHYGIIDACLSHVRGDFTSSLITSIVEKSLASSPAYTLTAPLSELDLDLSLKSSAARLELHEIKAQFNMVSAAAWRTLQESAFHSPFATTNDPSAVLLSYNSSPSYTSDTVACISPEVVYYLDTQIDLSLIHI